MKIIRWEKTFNKKSFKTAVHAIQFLWSKLSIAYPYRSIQFHSIQTSIKCESSFDAYDFMLILSVFEIIQVCPVYFCLLQKEQTIDNIMCY